MTNNCPECGNAMEFESREVRLRTGTCPSCSKEVAYLEGTTVPSRLVADSAEAGTPSPLEGGPECAECGSPLAIRVGESGALEGVCEDCESVTVFVPQREAPRPPARAERAPRFEDEAPRGRPCRKCGAPLRFTTNEEGLLTGECESCGNRFTLPPRAGGGRFDRDRPAARFPSNRYRGGGGRSFRPGSGGGGRRPYRRRDEEGGRSSSGDDYRRRKRRRDE